MSLLFLVLAGGGPIDPQTATPTSVAINGQTLTIAGSDPMAILGLLFIFAVIFAAISCFPSKRYECKECSFWSYSRTEAAGHVHIHSLHKIDL